MPHEQLNPPHVGAAFQQVGGKGVSQRVGRDGLPDAAVLARDPAGQRDRVAGNGSAGNIAGKQPITGMSLMPLPS